LLYTRSSGADTTGGVQTAGQRWYKHLTNRRRWLVDALEQLAADLKDWTGKEHDVKTLQEMCWALAHDVELSERFNALVQVERRDWELMVNAS
jgi:hypothetical protein